MDKEKLNRLRRMAGAPVDYSATPKKVAALVEDGIPGISQVFRGGDYKFYLVSDADKKSQLNDVLTELDFPALMNILQSAKDTNSWELFPHNEKNKALDLARKRLATVTETVGYGMEAGRPENTPYPTDDEIDSVVRNDSESDRASYEDFDEDDFVSDEKEAELEPATNICPDCEGGEHPPAFGECERCGGEGEIFEGKKENPFAKKDDKDEDDKDDDDKKDDDKDSDKDDDDKKDDDKDSDKDDDDKKDKKDKKDESDDSDDDDDEKDSDDDDDEKDVKESSHYHTNDNYSLTHKDGNQPHNVDASGETIWDKPEENEEDYRITNDVTPVKVPAKILSALKKVIDETTREAEKAKPRDFERSHYYEATAEAMQIVHDCLSEKTVQGLKCAQMYVHKMANVSRALLPDVVWKFIVDGGQKRSLKSYVNAVKDPVAGKPFGNIGISTLNKNTNTE